MNLIRQARSADRRACGLRLFVDEGNEEDGSTEITCDVSLGSAGVMNLACSGTVCQPDDCGEAQCDYPDCMETLTPSP